MLNYHWLNTRLVHSLFFITCFNFLAFNVQASPGALVYALQMPAWLLRDEIKKPLKPNMELKSGDSIISGSRARVEIHLDDGSLFKIGENAEIIFNNLQAAEETDGFFEGDIRIKKGAFRFTTPPSAFSKKRNISIQIGKISAQIEGTDIWGRSLDDADDLVLIEGSIGVQRIGEPEFEMKQSLSWYRVATNQPGQLTPTIEQTKLATWAAETELLTGGGVISVDGHWLINLMSLRDNNTLNKIRLKLARKGYTNSVKDITLNNTKWHRLQVKGFVSKADASIFAQSLESLYGFKKPWIVDF